MSQGSGWTVIVGALLTLVPQMLAIVPAEYRDVASGLLAAAVAAWHLYQPSPLQRK